jgi:hypothetical protein
VKQSIAVPAEGSLLWIEKVARDFSIVHVQIRSFISQTTPEKLKKYDILNMK